MYHKKKEIRKKILAARDKYTKEEIDEISATIFEKIKRLSCFQEAKTIMMYVTFGKELNTIDFMQYCIDAGKLVVTPICIHKTRSMVLAVTKNYPEGFKPTKMGIMEIPREDAVALDPKALDLIITPGLAFTLEGDRIGYGGGYYDRLFRLMNKNTILISPTFDEFIVESLPMGKYDRPVDIVISEKRSIFVSHKCEEDE